MKKLLKSYLTFNQTERMGLIALCSLLMALIVIRATMHFWVHPGVDTKKEAKLAAAWETFKRSHPRKNSDTTEQSKNDYEDAFDENEAPMPEIINLNTTDSATLVRLKGIGPVTASKIIAYRKESGPFTSVDQIAEIHHFAAATMKILKQHLTVDTSKGNK